MHARLTPTDGPLHVVRWVREDGRDIKHRYFRRTTDADTFATKLIANGKHPGDVATFTTTTAWSRR